MSRESSIKAPERALEASVEELIYSPTYEDRKLKAAFLALVEGNPLVDPSNLPIKEAERILGRKLPNRDAPGFAAWFLNRDENRQRLEYLFQLALGAAEDILMNTEPKAQGARVNMVKVVAELASKFPRQAKEGAPAASGSLEGAIRAMDKASLKLLLQKDDKSLTLEASKEAPIEAEVIKDE